MVDSTKQSSPHRWLLAVAILIGGLLLAPVEGRTEIIIDDFVDDLRINLPEDNLDRFRSANIGDLGVTRIISAGGVQTRPNGFLDINQTQSSALAVQMPNTVHTGSTPAAWGLLVYELDSPFGGIDLLEGGDNDAVILDFERLTADIPLRRIYVLAMRHRRVGSINTSSSYISTDYPIPQSPIPFSLIFPFDSFELARGAPIPDFDFSSIIELHVLVELALFDPSMPEQLGFDMVLNQIRIARVVPEPSTIVSLGLLSLMLCFARRHRLVFLGLFQKGVEPCGNERKPQQAYWQLS